MPGIFRHPPQPHQLRQVVTTVVPINFSATDTAAARTTDAPTFADVLLLAATDTAAARTTDAPTFADVLHLAATDTSAAVSDVLSLFATHQLTLSDTESIIKESSDPVKAAGFGKTLTDSQTSFLESSLTSQGSFKRSISDSQTSLIEEFTPTLFAGRFFVATDTIFNYAETLVLGIAFNRSISDTAFNYAETLIFSSSFVKTLSDTQTSILDTTPDFVIIIPMFLVDPFAIHYGETLGIVYNFNPHLTETSNLRESSLSRLAQFGRALSDTSVNYGETLTRIRSVPRILSDLETSFSEIDLLYGTHFERRNVETSTMKEVQASLTSIRPRALGPDTAVNYGETLARQFTAVRTLSDSSSFVETSLKKNAIFRQALNLSDTQTQFVEVSLNVQYIKLPIVTNKTLSDTQTHIVEASAPTFDVLPVGPIRVYPSDITFPQVGGPPQKISVYQTNYSGEFTAVSSDPTRVLVTPDPLDPHGFWITALFSSVPAIEDSFLLMGNGIDELLQKDGISGFLLQDVLINTTDSLLLGDGVSKLLKVDGISTFLISVELDLTNTGVHITITGGS